MSFLRKSGTEVNTPRAMTSHSILEKLEFDLVEPGRIARSEMQVNLRMSCQKVVDLPRLMGGAIVGNHVDLFSTETKLRVINTGRRLGQMSFPRPVHARL
jgi:hypothetical protein